MSFQLRKIVPIKLKNHFNHLQFLQHRIYSLNFSMNFTEGISDFFVWNKNCKKIDFIAENVRGLVSSKKILVSHNFKFFSKDGNYIETQKFETDDFIKRLTLKPIITDSTYCSFIHYVESDIDLPIFLKKEGMKNINGFCEYNRGSAIYFPGKTSIGGAVHGNFGGISKNLHLNAKQRSTHLYTPIYKFEENSIYDLVFNNPTYRKLIVRIIFNNNNKTKKIEIPSLGTDFVKIKDYTGSIGFQSKLPVCRALIFKNPSPNSQGNFDVFHS